MQRIFALVLISFFSLNLIETPIPARSQDSCQLKRCCCGSISCHCKNCPMKHNSVKQCHLKNENKTADNHLSQKTKVSFPIFRDAGCDFGKDHAASPHYSKEFHINNSTADVLPKEPDFFSIPTGTFLALLIDHRLDKPPRSELLL